MNIRKNWQLKLLFFLGFAPALLAWFMAGTGWGLPEGMKNHGELMVAGLVVPKGVTEVQRGRWGLMLMGEECGESCKAQLIVMQQVHKALGKEFGRLQSIWLKKNNHELFPPSKIPTESSELTEKMSVWFAQNALPVDDYSIWLIDPLGNLVLRYTPGTKGKDILADVRWLLKVSKIG